MLLCREYQFWEQRHPIEPDVHAKLRTRLKAQVKDVLKANRALSKKDLQEQLSQELVLAEHSQDPAELQRAQQLKEKKRREEEKRSVREAARKLLEIEMKAQEEAKEAQRKAKEDRKNAILEARMEIIRQKEARKEALRLAREEERRMREEEREIKRALREEEKRKKQEEKENSMKRRIEELRQRRKLREEQKSILENGVMTNGFEGGDSARGSEGGARKKFRAGAVVDPRAAANALRQKHLALLGFVDEEKTRRRRIRVWERKAELERVIWASVQEAYIQEKGGVVADGFGITTTEAPEDAKYVACSPFPTDVMTTAAELAPIPAELHADVLYVWDFISTFADCLRVPVLPSLAIFAKLLVLDDGSSPVGDGSFEEGSLGYALASVHAAIVKLLVSEYFPVLQMGTTLEEFYRTRPLNGLSWPELARLVCLLFIESNHPTSDEFLLKMLKGTKSYKDDSLISPLRRRLHNRGVKLVQGIKYEDAADNADAAEKDDAQANATSDVVKPPTTATNYYGLVLAPGQSKHVEFEEKEGGHLSVKSVAFDDETSTSQESPGGGDVEAAHRDLAFGDYLLSINGRNTKGMTVSELHALLSDAERPHGLLLSKIPPPAKGHAKHYATTTGSSKLKRCAHILKILRAKELAVPFNQPVDADLYPDYYSSIPDAMDLGTIAEKLEDEDYENDDDVETFMDDVALVWKNCYTYNSVKAEISIMARKLSVIFDRLMNEWVFTTTTRPLIVAEEDYCRRCQTNQVKDRLLLCDRCDAPYHTFCLDPPLAQIPSDEWYCPVCLKDPSFSPDQFRKKQTRSAGSATDQEANWVNEYELTDFEKRVLSVSELLGKENYSELAIGERVNILRVLCDLVHGTAVVQSVYHSLEEKATKLRRDYGEPLADLERDWRMFSPPRTMHNIEHTKRFFIDGVEHELTDELLEYLEAKAKAELEGLPVPELPQCARTGKDSHEGLQVEVIDISDESDCSADSDEDEESMLEKFSDRFLAESGAEGCDPTAQLEVVCAMCGLADGILNGSLVLCKRSPLTHHISQLDQYEVPQLLAEGDGSILRVRDINADDLAGLFLQDTPDGVVLVERHQTTGGATLMHGGDESKEEQHDPRNVLFAVNDCVVAGLSRQEIAGLLKTAKLPIAVYLTSLPCEVLSASVSIVKCSALDLGVNLGAFGSRIFVQSYASPSPSHGFSVGLGELCEQVFPGDVVYMVGDSPTLGKSVDEVQELLRLDEPTAEKYVVFVRPPNSKIRAINVEERRDLDNLKLQRTRIDLLRSELAAGGGSHPVSYDVVFGSGPLGLALGLEQGKVIVKSLNDHPSGILGQASLSRQIQQGDLVERVNNLVYGSVRDLSQFTSWLLSLPRPLKITFSQAENAGDSANSTSLRPPLEELAWNQPFLHRTLEVAADVTVKTYRCGSSPLAFELRQFVRSTCVVATDGMSRCEQIVDTNGDETNGDETNGETDGAVIEVGDQLVGMNGFPVSSVQWGLLAELLAQLTAKNSPVFLHFVAHKPKSVLLSAHLSCMQAANMARAECEFMLPQIEKARRLESFLETIVPRSLPLGKCRNGYSFYRFFSDRQRLYVVSADTKTWHTCQGRPQLKRLLAYLEEANSTSRDKALAARIRQLFHGILHGSSHERGNPGAYRPANSSRGENGGCCDLSFEKFEREGPFAVDKQIVPGTSATETEIFEAFVSCHGRRFALGSFGTRQAADSALQLAENVFRATGLHLPVAPDAVSLVNGQFPAIGRPVLKAESFLRRSLARKYEYSTITDSRGIPRAVAISHFVYQILKRGLHAAPSIRISEPYQLKQPGASLPGSTHSDGDVSGYSQNAESLKRRLSQASSMASVGQQNAALQAERWKRARTQEGNNAPMYGQPQAPRPDAQQAVPGRAADATTPGTFKVHLQSLVDRGRSMLAAWTQFSASASAQSASGLAYACLSSFEEVKKAASRILVDPHGPLPDPKTVVCLHHAYVLGLICAMAAQALSTSRMSAADSVLVKLVADCFATAILNCMDPSTILRSRALSSFAVVARQCEPAHRAPDLSPQLHHVANFILQFLRATQYLSTGNFEDLTRCRPITLHQGAASAFPISFIQQLALLQNIRNQFMRQLGYFSGDGGSASSAPYPQTQAPQLRQQQVPPVPPLNAISSMPMMSPRSAPSTAGNDRFVHVNFDHGPLGIVINYSERGTIIVTEFSGENGVMGQAQATGKVMIGDEVYAVNGRTLEAIGMEGFKAVVASGNRPLQVTFRRSGGVQGARTDMPSTAMQQQAYLPPTPASSQEPAMRSMSQVSAGAPTYTTQPVAAPSPAMYARQSGGMMMPTSSAVMSSSMSYAYPTSSAGSVTNTFGNMEPLPFTAKPKQGRPMGMGNVQPSPYGPGAPPAELNPYMNGGGMPNPYFSRQGPPSYGQMGMYGGVQGATLSGPPMGQWQNTSMPMGMPPAMPPQNMPVPGGLPNPDTFAGMAPAGSGNVMSPNHGGAPQFMNFVAPNDPRLSEHDSSQVSYYDANGTTYRSGEDFELDVTATSEANAREEDGEASAQEDGDASTQESAQDGESQSISQMTTPTQSDTEEDVQEVDQQEQQTRTLEAVATALQTPAPAVDGPEVPGSNSDVAPAVVPGEGQLESSVADTAADTTATPQPPVEGPAHAEEGNNSADTEESKADKADETGGGAGTRRSSRVSKKITTNIADMYDPNLSSKLAERSATSGVTGSAEPERVEPTDGEVGELATELLESFHKTIRPVKTDAARSLLLLRAQLLTVEAAIPREAFRPGKWTRPIRAAWAELVCSSESSRSLLEAIVYIESCIEVDWLDPCWKASPIQTGRNAVANATIASAAMRLYALDDAITYVRSKRPVKRKHHRPSSSASSSRQSSPIKVQDLTETAPALDPSTELTFLSLLSPGLVEFASKRLQRIVDGQRDKTLTMYLYRKVRARSDIVLCEGLIRMLTRDVCASGAD